MKILRNIAVVSALLLSLLFCGASEREVAIENREAGITLAGTLTEPDGKIKAALVLATGSGSQNRDEEILGHRPFKRIADFLGERGYAVLRFDDRGVGGSGGDPEKTTVHDYAGDLACAMVFLDSCLNVPVGALGHSEGGSAVVLLAGKKNLCRFVVTLGAPAWRGDSIIMSQARAMALATGGRWEGEQMQRRYLDMVMSDMPDILLRTALYTAVASDLGDAAGVNEVRKQIRIQTDMMSTPAYRSLVKYDPAEDIKAVAVPWLALNGDKDMQVLPANLETIGNLNPIADRRLMKDHNHLFQRCSTGMVQEYAAIAEDISEETLTTIADWLDSIGF